MKKRVGLSIAALSVLAVASAGFASYRSSYSTPYATPVVEALAAGDDGTFDGLLRLAETSPRSSTVKVLWTHGMCTHPPSWVDSRMRRLVEAVGGTAETVSVRAIGSHGASMRTDRISTQGKTIEVKFLSWSPLTAPYKAALDYDSSALHGGGVRATLNRELKGGLVNDCLTDVVVYGGPNGFDIRQAMNEAVCEALGGRFDGTECDVPAGASPEALALVTESLGSKLLCDAVLHIWNAANNSSDKTAVRRLATSLAAAKVMYMLSNQVPLLDFGRFGGDGQDPGDGVGAAEDAYQRRRRVQPAVAGPASGAAGDRAHDRGCVFRSQRSPELPDHSGSSCRRPEGIPRHQRSGIERRHLLRLSGTSRHGTLRLSLESPCLRHAGAGISGRKAIAFSVRHVERDVPRLYLERGLESRESDSASG